jgi:tRNA pseudouridine13 synthase
LSRACGEVMSRDVHSSTNEVGWDRVPYVTPDLPGTGGRLRDRLDDFVVEELVQYEPCGNGPHCYLWIEKRGIDTPGAVQVLAEFLGRRPAEIGVAGRKDKYAVARQYVSVEHVPVEQLESFSHPQVSILSVTHHTNKLRVGHLTGNRFEIVVRVPTGGQDDAVARAQAVVARLARHGVPNFFGPQRFGRAGANVPRAYRMLTGRPLPDRLAERWGREENEDKRRPTERFSSFHTFLLNSLQSALFNEVLALRLETFGKLYSGDLAFLHRSGAVFQVMDAEREQPRADAFEISPSGPLVGRDLISPAGYPREIEDEVLSRWGIGGEHLASRAMRRAPGARRPLRVPLPNASVEAHENGYKVRFDLPAGTYATVVMQEVMKSGLA